MTDPLEAPLARLRAEGRLRLWSLAVTFFGDAVEPRGGAVAMADLSRLLERVGAEPGAVRTALSRLARDGWVERLRDGRRSSYRLAGRGLAESRAAAPRIYAAEPPDWDGTWTALIAPEGEPASGFRRLLPGLFLAPGDAPVPAGAFAIRGGRGAPPDWARAALSPPPLAARYAALAEAWAGFAPPEAPEDAMAARLLLVHDWRRTLLRDAPLPRALRPEGWPGAAARDLVARLYRALAPASEAWLDGCEAEPGAALPPPDAAFGRRFGGL